MKFLVDAQLPVRLARFIQASGYDTLHTRDLPRQNATSDKSCFRCGWGLLENNNYLEINHDRIIAHQ